MAASSSPEGLRRSTEFEGTVALVLGASRGIGAVAAHAFARRGARVVLASRDDAALSTVRSDIEQDGGWATVRRTDLADRSSVEGLGAWIVAELGRLDFAFNNAGEGAPPRPLAEIDPSTFEEVVRVTVLGTFLALRAEIPLMVRGGGGAIVNMSSTAGTSAFAGGAPYVAAKHAVLGLTKSAAVDYAAQGVRVNAVAPGPIDTHRLRAAPEEYRERARQAVPLHRLGTPEEVAETVVWLSSPAAGFITGTTVFVDGGRMAGWV